TEFVDEVPVTRLRFVAPDSFRPLAESFRHPGLQQSLAAIVDEMQPDLVFQVSGYLFGVTPLTVADAREIPAVLLATDFWHMCHRVTLLRPDVSLCAGPRHPADCAACQVAATRLA